MILRRAEDAVFTAGVVVAAIALGGFIVYSKWFAPKISPVGGIQGADQISSGMTQIVSGVKDLATPFENLWSSVSGIFSHEGAGSALPNQSVGGSPTMPTSAKSQPAWLNTMQSAVNSVGQIQDLFNQITKVGK